MQMEAILTVRIVALGQAIAFGLVPVVLLWIDSTNEHLGRERYALPALVSTSLLRHIHVEQELAVAHKKFIFTLRGHLG